MVLLGALSLVWAVATAPCELRIHDIQGSRHLSPLVGQPVSAVPGVVVALRADGFHMQDDAPDGDDATSEGVRVRGVVAVSPGDRVAVDGVVRERRNGCAPCGPRDRAYGYLTTTEIEARSVVVLARGAAPPPATSWFDARAGALLPDPDDARRSVDVEGANRVLAPYVDRLDRDESLEGMRVALDDAVAAGPPSLVEGYREIAVRRDLEGESVAVAGELGVVLPDASLGDRFAGRIEGVLDYRAGHFVLVADAALPRALSALPAPRVAAAPTGAGELTVGAFNLQNFGPASSPDKRSGLAATIVSEMGAPDVLIVEEMQDASGPRDDGTVSAELNYAALNEAITGAGGVPYVFRDLPPDDGQDGGEPGANIRVAVGARADRGLHIVERSFERGQRVAALAAGTPLRLRESPARIAPEAPAFIDSRKPLVLELTRGDQVLFVVACHFVSQLADPPLYGRYQPPARLSRAARNGEASEVARFVAALLARDPSADVLVLGDLNDIPSSPAVQRLEESGLIDVLADVAPNERFTHVYRGAGEALDYILVSPHVAAARVSARVVHGTAGHAPSASDHDPVVARFRQSDDVAPLRTRGRAGCQFTPLASTWTSPTLTLVAAVVAARLRLRRAKATTGRPVVEHSHIE